MGGEEKDEMEEEGKKGRRGGKVNFDLLSLFTAHVKSHLFLWWSAGITVDGRSWGSLHFLLGGLGAK